MTDVAAMAIVIGIFFLLWLADARWGEDSRDGEDWHQREPW